MLGDATLLGDARSEIRLDLLLDEMLAGRRGKNRRGAIAAPASIIELRDTARRLRAASLWTPLPEGRLTVRQALLVATQHGANLGSAGRAAWRRAGIWLSGTAIVAILTVWSFAAGMGDHQPELGPAHALRLLLQRSQLALAPHHARYALSYDFLAIQLPAGSATTSIQGRVGGLPVTLSVTPATGTCASTTACGTFTVAPAQLPGAAGEEFGKMSGTFGCGADGACTFAFAEMTGVFATIEQPALSVGAIGQRHGRLTTKLASLKDWVSTVASAGQKLQAEALLPAGLTIKDLTTAAGANGAALHGGGGGQGGGNDSGPQNSTNVDDTRGGGSARSGSPASSPTGAAAGPTAGAVQPGPGARSSTPGGPHSTRHGETHSAPAGQGGVHADGTNVGGARGTGPGASQSTEAGAGQANGASPRSRHGLNAARDRDPASPSASSGDDDRGPVSTGQREVNHNQHTGSGVHDSGHRAGSTGPGSAGGGGAGGGRTTSGGGKHDGGRGDADKSGGDKGDGDKGDGGNGDGGKGDGGNGGGGDGGGGKGGGGKGGGN